MTTASSPSCAPSSPEELDGVQHSETDSRRGRTVVVANPATTPHQIIATIADAGYHAELIATD